MFWKLKIEVLIYSNFQMLFCNFKTISKALIRTASKTLHVQNPPGGKDREWGRCHIQYIKNEYLWMDRITYVLCSLLINASWNCQLKKNENMKADTGMLQDLHMLKKDENGNWLRWDWSFYKLYLKGGIDRWTLF